MKPTWTMFVLAGAALVAAAVLNASTVQEQLNGTWSGSWTPNGGIRDAMTIELRHDDKGKLTGRFVTPTPVDFTSATFESATRTLKVQAMDAKTGKPYKVEARLDGTELKGSIVVGTENGQVQLTKWTYVPRIGN